MNKAAMHEALRALNGHCDGAVQRDAQGFSKADTVIGDYLCLTPWEAWTPEDEATAQYLCRYYWRQLRAYGHDLTAPEKRDERAWLGTHRNARLATQITFSEADYTVHVTDRSGRVTRLPLPLIFGDGEHERPTAHAIWKDIARRAEAGGLPLPFTEEKLWQCCLKASAAHVQVTAFSFDGKGNVRVHYAHPQHRGKLWPIPEDEAERAALASGLAALGPVAPSLAELTAESLRVTEERRAREEAAREAARPVLTLEGNLLSVKGKFDPARKNVSRNVRGRHWNEIKERDDFPLHAYEALLRALAPFNLLDTLTPEQRLMAQQASQAEDARLAALPRPVQLDFAWVDGEGEVLAFTFPYNPALKDRLAQTLPLVWKPEPLKAWCCPVEHLSAALHAAEQERLHSSEALRERARVILEAQAARRSAEAGALHHRQTLDAAFESGQAPVLGPPGLSATPLPWQSLPALLSPLAGRLLLADEQGLGKTLEAIILMLHEREQGRGGKTVILCPTNLKDNWRAELEEHAPGQFPVFEASGRKAVTSIPPDVQTVLIGWDVLDAWVQTLSTWEPQLLIGDEGQLGKSGKGSDRGAAYLALCAQVRKRHPQAGGVVVMTGTPIVTRPRDLCAQLDALGVIEDFGGTQAFLTRYCGPKKVFTGERYVMTYNGASHTAELAARLRGYGWYVRRSKKLLVQLGHMQRKVVNGVDFYDYATPMTPPTVILDAEASTTYRDLVTKFGEFLKGELLRDLGFVPDDDVLTGLIMQKMKNVLPKLGLLRQHLGQAKVSAVTRHVRQLNAQGEQVLIVAHHREVVDAYAAEFGGLKIQGGMTGKKIEAAKRRFNTSGVDEAPAFVISQEAGRLGHTLCLQRRLVQLPECRHVVIAEETYNPGEEAQAQDRVWRIPQTREVTVSNLLAVLDDGGLTIDHGLFNLREAKRRSTAVIVDGEPVDGDADLSGLLSVWIRALLHEQGGLPAWEDTRFDWPGDVV